MMIRNKFTKGFTLVELMVFLVFISILLAASTPLITKKAKSVPSRSFHGKYLFYRDPDNGSLHKVYYNSSGRPVEDEVTDGNEITFTPPRRATMFKVKLIGAGAGGYNFGYYSNLDAMPRVVESDGKGGYETTDNSLPDGIPDSLMQSQMQGEKNHITIFTGDGGDGGSLSYRYYPPKLSFCKRATYVESSVDGSRKYHYYNPDDVDNSKFKSKTCDLWGWNPDNYCPTTLEQYQNILSALSEEDYSTSSLDKLKNVFSESVSLNTLDTIRILENKVRKAIASDKELSDPVNEDGNSFNRTVPSTGFGLTTPQSRITKHCNSYGLMGLDISSPSETQVKYGGEGGKGKYLTLEYTIDFDRANGKSVNEYLSYLNEYYQGGSCLTSGCAGSTFRSKVYPQSGADGLGREFTSNRPINRLPEDMHGVSGYSSEDGKDASAYAAFKFGSRYLTNKEKATGGTGVAMIVRSDGVMPYHKQDGTDASDDFYSIGGVTVSGGRVNDPNGNAPGSEPRIIVSGAPSAPGEDLTKVTWTVNVPRREYYIGARGADGDSMEYRLSSLGDSCTVRIPPHAYSNVIEGYADSTIAYTELECNGWRSPLQVASGQRKQLCREEENSDSAGVACRTGAGTFPILDPVLEYDFDNRNVSISYDDNFEPFDDVHSSVFGIDLSSENIFTRMLNGGILQTPFGRGGSGPMYVDHCPQLGGSHTISNNRGDSNTVNFESRNCTENFERTQDAMPGMPGAVLISW